MKISITSIAFAIVLLIACYFIWCELFGQHVAPGVTQNNLMKLRVGMPKSDVIEIIGEPLYPDRYPRIYQYAESCRICLGEIELTLTYDNELLSYAGAEYFDLGFWWLRKPSGPEVTNHRYFNRFIRK